MRNFMLSALLMTALPAFCASANATPVVNSGVVNSETNQIPLRGSGFEPATTVPSVLFNATVLRLVLPVTYRSSLRFRLIPQLEASK